MIYAGCKTIKKIQEHRWESRFITILQKKCWAIYSQRGEKKEIEQTQERDAELNVQNSSFALTLWQNV